MQQDSITAAFAEILEEVANVNRAEVARDKRLREDLGIDSLSLIDVAVAAEDTFGIRIPDDDLERLQTVGDVVGYIGHFSITTSSRAVVFGQAKIVDAPFKVDEADEAAISRAVRTAMTASDGGIDVTRPSSGRRSDPSSS